MTTATEVNTKLNKENAELKAEIKDLKAKLANLVPDAGDKPKGTLVEFGATVRVVALEPKIPNVWRSFDIVVHTIGGHEFKIWGGKIKKWTNEKGEERIFVDYPGYTKTDAKGVKTYPEWIMDPKFGLKNTIIDAVRAGLADEVGSVVTYNAVTGEKVVRPPKAEAPKSGVVVNGTELPGGPLNGKDKAEQTKVGVFGV